MYIGKKYTKRTKVKENEKISRCGCCGNYVVVPKEVNDEDVYGPCCCLSDKKLDRIFQAKSWEELPFAHRVFYGLRDKLIYEKLQTEEAKEMWNKLEIWQKIAIINKMIEEGKMA